MHDSLSKPQTPGDFSTAPKLHSLPAVSTSGPRKRQHWVDYAKGIAIGLVVLGHVNLGLIAAGLVEGRTQSYLSAVNDFIYCFHMPVFFFVGGLFVERLRRRSPTESLIALGRTIVYPYFVWAAIQQLLLLTFRSYTNHTASIYDLATIVVEPPMQFWFLYVYFLIVLAYLLIAKSHAPKFAIAAIFVAFWVLAACGLHTPWQPLFLAQFYGVFFVAGDIARARMFSSLAENSPTPHWWLPVGISCFLLLALMTSLIESSMEPLSGFVGIAGTCCLAAFLAARHSAGVVRLCGIFSLEIYVLHTLFSAAARIGLERVLGITSLPIHIGVGVLAGLGAPLLIAFLASENRLGWLFRFPDLSRQSRFIDEKN